MGYFWIRRIKGARKGEVRMHIIELKNGKNVCIGGYNDALDVIREELGDEITTALEEDITDTLEEMRSERDIQHRYIGRNEI